VSLPAWTSHRENAFLADAIILQRYVELDGVLRPVMTVIKVWGSDHSKDLRLYEVHSTGLTIGDTIPLYLLSWLLTADPRASTAARSPSSSRRRRET
jgi:circadian clock protein KaiC